MTSQNCTQGWYTTALAAGTPKELLTLGINAFYASPRWKAVRFDVLAACPRCCLCGSGEHLHVDHIVPLKVDWGRRLDTGNLQVLCRDCNHGKASRDSTDFRTPNERADLMYPLMPNSRKLHIQNNGAGRHRMCDHRGFALKEVGCAWCLFISYAGTERDVLTGEDVPVYPCHAFAGRRLKGCASPALTSCSRFERDKGGHREPPLTRYLLDGDPPF